jgi:Mn2+/Fe2+ NRAMP family transporter
MEWYFYLHYKIYAFYVKKKDSTPCWYSASATALLIYFNIFCIFGIIGFFGEFLDMIKYVGKYEILILPFSLLVINYLILYRKKKYIEVFDYFRKNIDSYKKWDKSVKIYIIGSIIIFLLVLIFADLRNHNFELYFLK